MMEFSLCVSLILIQNTHEIGTVGVELTTKVIRGQVNLGLINETSDLEVRLGLDELETSDGTSGDETGTTSGLGTPGDLLMFGLTNGGAGVGGGPKTPVIGEVHVTSLAQGAGTLSGGVATVVAGLGTTNTIVGISLVWL